eukprot:1346273-Rhodomonas_salina.1
MSRSIREREIQGLKADCAGEQVQPILDKAEYISSCIDRCSSPSSRTLLSEIASFLFLLFLFLFLLLLLLVVVVVVVVLLFVCVGVWVCGCGWVCGCWRLPPAHA